MSSTKRYFIILVVVFLSTLSLGLTLHFLFPPQDNSDTYNLANQDLYLSNNSAPEINEVMFESLPDDYNSDDPYTSTTTNTTTNTSNQTYTQNPIPRTAATQPYLQPNNTPTPTPVPTATLMPTTTPTPTPSPTPSPTEESEEKIIPEDNTPIYPPGDANEDGEVDELDFQIWQDNYGKETTRGHLDADFNTDGIVNGKDYTIWFNYYQS